ncbi:MAG: rod shape-determining protein MreD [Chitinivibrionia bacterium]|nr:rod shape-determining protein MreD [Chitinivibrionia bacterium]
MKTAVVVITGLLFLLLQMIAANKIALGPVEPDFPLLFVVYVSLYRGSFQGTLIGFGIGFLQDLFNPSLLGLNALLKSILGSIAGRIGSTMERDSALFLALILVVSQLAHDLIYMVFYYGFNIVHILKMFAIATIPSSLYTALVGVLVHKVCSSLGLKAVRIFGKAK